MKIYFGTCGFFICSVYTKKTKNRKSEKYENENIFSHMVNLQTGYF